jgi:CheY-like chemotaxis protein
MVTEVKKRPERPKAAMLTYSNREFPATLDVAVENTSMAIRILVVDDDPMVSAAIELCLAREGFDVTVTDGGAAGLNALEASSFDLMLIDIFMPHMRGFESIRIFHERAPAIPLIAMSGYAFANFDVPSPDFLQMTLDLGASRCLRKPFKPQALLAVINDCLMLNNRATA